MATPAVDEPQADPAIEWPAWVEQATGGRASQSPSRTERTAAILGVVLGVSFTVCFLTGLYSHWAQSSDPLITFPSRPAGLYRVTQGVHVFTGVLSIPLLLAKLWAVLPRFFELPPVRSIAHGLERLALFPLVGGSLFLLLTGLNNIVGWYPWEFGFVAAHYWAAWITIGGLIVHIGSKIALTRHALRPPRSFSSRVERSTTGDRVMRTGEGRVGGLERRGFFAVVSGTAAFLAVSVSAQTVRPFRRLGLFSPRDLTVGVQGFPVNSSAARRRVVEAAMSPDYRLRVTGAVDRELSFTLEELQAMEQHEATLPIACVEGWSKSARWRGVRVRDLLAMAGAAPDSACTVRSLQESGGFRSSFVNRDHAADRDLLLALEINGEPLHLDHGFPVRLIGPNRPGVNQTKWVNEVRVS